MHIGKSKIIAHNKYNASRFDALTVIFHHGFMSDMNGHKALSLEKFCQKRDINFIRYDNYGNGKSSGQIIDQNLSSWIEGAEYVVKNFTNQKNIIHVGSSLGGWIATYLTLKYPSQVIGLVNIAPAFDFTKKLIWDHLTDHEKEKFKQDKIFYLQKEIGEVKFSYPITFDLIEDAKKYHIFERDLEFNCPVHIVHGMKDLEVPYQLSIEFIEKMKSPGVLKLINDGSHSLSRMADLEVLFHSIDEIIKGAKEWV